MTSALVRLADFAGLSSGGTPSRSVPKYFTGQIPWIKTLDLNNGWVSGSEEKITEDGLRSFRGDVLPAGTILVAMYGGAGTIGKSGILAVPAAINQALCAIRPLPTRCDTEYLHLWLLYARPQWMQFSAGNRKDPNINKQVVANMRLRLPDLIHQKSVAARLKVALQEANTCIEGVSQQIGDAEKLVRGLLTEQFGNRDPVSAGRIDDGLSEWKSQPLLQLARLESGHTPSRRRPEWWGGEVPWLALPDIRKLHGKIAQQTTENTNDAGLANSSARLLPVGTVCFSRTASVGFVCILGKPMATSQDFCNWICDPEKLAPEFLMYAFMASQDSLRELGSGAVHKTIYMPTLESFHVCAPELPEQKRIARRLREQLTAAESLQTRLKERLAEIERLPQRILAAAFDPVRPEPVEG